MHLAALQATANAATNLAGVQVFRGSRARSLHLARRWISRAFYRWVSSTLKLRARMSLPGTLRRAESVLEKILFT
jgi:hypothetical protein